MQNGKKEVEKDKISTWIVIIAILAICAMAVGAAYVYGTYNAAPAREQVNTIDQQTTPPQEDKEEKEDSISEDGISKRYRERMTKYNTKPE